MKFNVTIDRDEDGVWIVECPAIPGCVSQGPRRDEGRGAGQRCRGDKIVPRSQSGPRFAANDRNAADRSCRLMPVLPVLSGHQVVRVFESFGWCIARQRGSPVILIVRDQGATLSVQDPREIAKGTLRSLVRATVLTVEAFVAEAEKRCSYGSSTLG